MTGGPAGQGDGPRRAPGWVWIRGLRVDGVHLGTSAEERAAPQAIEVDIGLQVDLAAAARRDVAEATIDWAWLRSEVRRLATIRPRALVETVAVDLAHGLLSASAALAVRCEVRKPGALPDACAAVSVRLRRRG